MKEAIIAALATLLAATGIAGGSFLLMESKPPPLPTVKIPEPYHPPIELMLVKVIPQPYVEPFMAERPIPYVEPLMVEREAFVAETLSIAGVSVSSSPSNTGMGDNVEQWRPLVTATFGAGLADTALCLMSYESGGNPGATNPDSGASGLMQVMPAWAGKFGYARNDLYDPAINLTISRALYDDNGWNHWSPWLRGECR